MWRTGIPFSITTTVSEVVPHTPDAAVNDPFWSLDRLRVLPLLTLLVLLTHAPEVWYLQTPLVVLITLALMFEPWRQAPQLWFLISLCLGTTLYLNWESCDNHKYVITYWCLTLCAAFTAAPTRQTDVIQHSSRWLIGLCMLWATLWKIATPEYRDGTFFTYELLSDERFAHFTALFGGTSLATLAENRELRDLIVHGYTRGMEISSVQLSSSPGVAALAWCLTWWTVAIEGALAVLFLWRDHPRIATLRNGLLLFFAVTTYAVATVRGFGWMLMLLGMAQTTEEQRRWRMAYFSAFLLIQLYTLPLADLWQRLQ
jgi:hypothetical protein